MNATIKINGEDYGTVHVFGSASGYAVAALSKFITERNVSEDATITLFMSHGTHYECAHRSDGWHLDVFKANSCRFDIVRFCAGE